MTVAPYDGFGARIHDHYPIPTYYPGSMEQPEELTVYCSCGDWSYESIASAGGPCDTWWQDEYATHLEEVDE